MYYPLSMKFETVVSELLVRFPYLRTAFRDYMADEDPLAYVAFGCVVIPLLEKSLAERNMVVVRELCEYFESVAVESKADSRLADLLRVEIGEWLPSAPHQDILGSQLGVETKRVCAYIPRRVD
jgi:hypothetical protein